LLEKDLNGESFRRISEDFGYSETALRRHLNEHLSVELSHVKAAKEEARAEALEKVKAEELEGIKDGVKEGMAARLENAAGFLDQLKEVRSEAANLLDKAEKSDDLKAAGVFLREVREQIKLMAELEGKLANQPQINILVDPQWVELRTSIMNALEAYPAAKEAVVLAIHK
jgi:flagellar biosynthesis chaperone FliJ